MDLEARLAQASEELAQVAHLGTGGGAGGGGKRGNREWVPSAPARHTFSGHRLAVNALAFHPTFSSLATASEDTTLKVWDWESGELERTLKGHTKSVTDCQYDSKGKVLGKPDLYPCHSLRVLMSRKHHVPMIYSSSCGRSTKTTKTLQHSADTSTPYPQSDSCRAMIA
jgi:WD40 repeat protein